ncbi:hypothetical protein [uncultured Megasphaera sp.]|uniref:hypothetical protein n=1 Tax=Megasphaera massiliensis TaxID=1232428 RepID=UPI00266D1674|nr:hypothetical protein [uncultured Megasphaera sp.]
MNSNTQKALESLRRREINSSIAIAADLANDNPNSICRLALAWISDGNVHGISYLIKPREGPIETRHVTEYRLKDSKPFDAVWDEEISVLIGDAFLSAYHSEALFTSIKASYEASGRKWPIHDVYIRDLQFLAATYIPNLANDSLTSILHRMDIAVDMDSAISRAMACICGLSWLEERYPISTYGMPLSSVMAGALRPRTEVLEQADPDGEEAEEEKGKYSKWSHYTNILLLPFVILCLVLTIHYIHRQREANQSNVNFSQYSQDGVPDMSDAEKEAQPKEHRLPSSSGRYLMMRGTYVIPDKETIPVFLKASRNRDMETIRALVRSDKILIFAKPTRIQITEDKAYDGFIPIKILEGDYANQQGFAAENMITK